ncbi:MAG: hypothetical protein V3U80_10880 [Flavobacteriaceae bacterium]
MLGYNGSNDEFIVNINDYVSENLNVTLEWFTDSDIETACEQDLDLYLNINTHESFRHSFYNCPEVLTIYNNDIDRTYSVIS